MDIQIELFLLNLSMKQILINKRERELSFICIVFDKSERRYYNFNRISLKE